MKTRSVLKRSIASPMPPPSGEQASIFLANIPTPTPVWGYDGARLGYGRGLALDQASGQTLCLLVGRGLTVRRFRPIPWAALRYDPRSLGYVADVCAELFMQGPVWINAALEAPACVRRAHLYYDVYHERQEQT